MSLEIFSNGEYLPSVRQVVQDRHSFGVGVKHIGQTIQTVLKHLVGFEGAKVPVLKHVVGIEGVKVPVLKHLVGIEGVKVPSESSNRRMILESNCWQTYRSEKKC
jgi:type IV secretory pathway protease TraF